MARKKQTPFEEQFKIARTSFRPLSTHVKKDRPVYGSSLLETERRFATDRPNNPAESLVTAGGARTSLSTLREDSERNCVAGKGSL